MRKNTSDFLTRNLLTSTVFSYFQQKLIVLYQSKLCVIIACVTFKVGTNGENVSYHEATATAKFFTIIAMHLKAHMFVV